MSIVVCIEGKNKNYDVIEFFYPLNTDKKVIKMWK